ncbi:MULTISPECIES: class I adenylate-forming enzyme family protein [Streptomyces]|uniref:AMP-binding protein n=1 Tax=Streptomyces doebereineriae TaxID=3075528 RepID=A0ABU2V8J0_9ACTN|nr:AMP-binding protein [Streptomyces sp. DSM 41640]MDT0481881.1 AMP-binding protein [Streptomyces sp. DSM 41640]
MTDAPVFERLLAAMRERGGAPALEDGRESLSYLTVASMIDTCRADLATAGLVDGDRVSVVIRQRCSDVVNLLAVMTAGGVAVPCDAVWPEHRRSLTESNADVRMRLDGETCVVLNKPGASTRLKRDPRTDSLALLMYTSGSTAEPRGVMVQADQIEFCTERIGERLAYTVKDRIACPVRLSFDYGLYQIFLAFSTGATLVLCDVTDPFGWLRDAIRHARPTVLALTPSMARAAVSKWHRSGEDDRVRLVTFTGESVDRRVIAGMTDAFPHASIVLMYGVTECKRVSISEPDEWRRDPTSVGRPLTGTSVVIRDQRGDELPAGEVGEIHVLGPNLSSGYWRDLELTERKFPLYSGRRELATEDLGYVDSSDRLHIVGRIGDTYKERGQRVSAQEVEAAALSCDGVRGAVCIPPRAETKSTLFVSADDRVTQHDLLVRLGQILGTDRIPRRIARVDELPLTPNGKADRVQLRKIAGESTGSAW